MLWLCVCFCLCGNVRTGHLLDVSVIVIQYPAVSNQQSTKKHQKEKQKTKRKRLENGKQKATISRTPNRN